ncbi:MAG: murein hydrolase activator EnvC family protein [Muribaculaceae bacterium]
MLHLLRKSLLLILATAIIAAATPDAYAKKKQSRKATTTTAAAPRSAKQVQQEKKKTAKEIEQARQQLAENTKNTRRQLNKLSTLDAEISTQAGNITRLSASLDSLNGTIKRLNDTINDISDKVATLRKGYAEALRMMRARRQSTSNFAFIFSSRSFTEAYRRIRYLRELNSWNADKRRHLRSTLDVLDAKRSRLAELQAQHSDALSKMTIAQTALRAKQTETAALVDNLKREKTAINKVLTEKKKQAERLDRELDRIIAEEARKAEEARRKAEAEAEARRKAEEAKRIAQEQERLKKEQEQKALAQNSAKSKDKAATKKDKTGDKAKDKAAAATTPAATPKPASEAKNTKTPTYAYHAEASRALTGSFEQNKGRLLFPVAGNYSIVSTFGTNNHPELSAVKINNSGIDIQVPKGSRARAVYDGYVSSVFVLEGYHNIVIVRHGEYLTVYAGIDVLSVKKGDKVKANQTLGSIYSDPDDDGRTVLHFEIRREKQKLNPLEWIR